MAMLDEQGLANLEEMLRRGAEGGDPEAARLYNMLYADYEGREQALADQLARADALRDTPIQDMRQVGRLHVAAGPGEILAGYGQRALGDYRQRQIDQRREDLSKDKDAALQQIARQTLGQQKMPATQPMVPNVGAGTSPLNIPALLAGLRR